MSNLAIKEHQPEPAGAAADDAADVRPVPRITVQAFCETPDLAAALDTASADRRMAKAHVKVLMGGLAAAIEFYGAAPTPNLIVVETRQSGERLVADLERLAEVCDAGTRLVVVGHVNDVTLYRDLVRRGVSEYLVAPLGPVQMIRTIADLYAERTAGPLGRSLAFIGGKGGVGSSMVAHNVAWAISRDFSSDVVLADLDLAFGTAGLDFNQDPAQGIAEALHSPERLDDTFFDRLLARCSEHLSLLAAPASLDRTYDFDESAFQPVIDLAQGGVPAVVLDLPHVWTGWSRATLIAADEIVLTVEPDLANLRNAKNLVDLVRPLRRHDAPPRLIVNKVGMPKRPEIKPAEFAEHLGLEPLVTIPFDAHLFGTAANNGQMIGETDAKSPVAQSFVQIAQVITNRGELRRPKRSGLGSILGALRAGARSG